VAVTKRQQARIDLAELNLSAKERQFVEFYLGRFHGNATRAAYAAGYGTKLSSAAVQAHRLLRNVKIREALEARIAASPEVADVKECQEFFTSVMKGRGQFATTKESDRLKAGELLVRTQGGFTDKHVIGASGDLLELLSSIPVTARGRGQKDGDAE
jgi:hypothetical protein